jgi:hypothetical protein
MRVETEKGGPVITLRSVYSGSLQVHRRDALAANCFAVTLTNIKTQEPNAFKAK